MGLPDQQSPVLRIVAAFSRHDRALDWAQRQINEHWGPFALVSDRFDFVETDYYESTMGTGLRKQFFALEHLVDAAELVQWKQETNCWEQAYTELRIFSESRPLNLDPGYMNEAKIVLASTKDHAHRIYLRDGIFGEVTLFYRSHSWQPREWTFPDYRRKDYHEFFIHCRNFFRKHK